MPGLSWLRRTKHKRIEIDVCFAGSCLRAGSEAVLLEIEELAKSTGGCFAQQSGCLGGSSPSLPIALSHSFLFFSFVPSSLLFSLYPLVLVSLSCEPAAKVLVFW
jgi:hypothetical protein